MSNITYAFNTTGEFYSVFLRNLSLAFGRSIYSGLFLWAFSVFMIHKISGFRASVPAGLGFAVLLANAGLLPSWVSPLVILITGTTFAVVVYEKTLAKRV